MLNHFWPFNKKFNLELGMIVYGWMRGILSWRCPFLFHHQLFSKEFIAPPASGPLSGCNICASLFPKWDCTNNSTSCPCGINEALTIITLDKMFKEVFNV